VNKLTPHQIKIYPNPATNYIQVDLDEAESYEILDMTGKSYLNLTATDSNKIDISGLSNGIYFIRAIKDQQVYSGRFVKM
jgi:hypothetical protein